MKIYVNGRFLMHKQTGIERYAYEICRALIDRGIDLEVICPRTGVIDSSYDVSGMHIIRYGIGHSHFWEQCILPFFFLFINAPLLCLSGIGPILVRNKVITIHDVSFLVNPSWFSKSYATFYRIFTRLAVKTSKHVITVSEFSKSEILKYYGDIVSPNKVSVVYGASKFHPVSLSSNSEISSNRQSFLAVASLDPRKNLAILPPVIAQIPGLHLKIVGSKYKVFSDITQVDTEQITYLGRVSDEILANLYSTSIALIFPSFYEGFGLPPIEAQMAGCPVLVSDIPVMHEVCGDSAIYFDPNDKNDICAKIQYILSLSESERQQIIDRGRLNAQRFSFTKSCEAIISIFLKF